MLGVKTRVCLVSAEAMNNQSFEWRFLDSTMGTGFISDVSVADPRRLIRAIVDPSTLLVQQPQLYIRIPLSEFPTLMNQLLSSFPDIR